jgi:MFS family permease
MGLLSKVEDRPTPSNVYNWRVYACGAVAGSAAIMIGYDSAFIGTTLALPSFKTEFQFGKLSTDAVNLLNANIVSCYQAGAFFGSIFAYLAAFFLGRTRGLAIFSAIFVLGAGLMLGANGERGLGLIYAGRVLAGLGVGGCSNLAPIYISEISPPAIRGRLVCMFELGWQIGGLVGFWINVRSNPGFRNALADILCSTVFPRRWLHLTSNGSSPLPSNSSRQLFCSSAAFGFMNRLAG